MYKIPEIKLLAGSHANTGTTGVGCFMNVVAYLNGEPQITDQSECVCFVVRPIAIWLNDYCDDSQRQRLLPFILRALGSRSSDIEEITRRVRLVVAFAETQKQYAAEYAANAANAAAESAESAANAATYAAEYAAYAANAATYATYAANAAARYAANAAKSAAAMKEKIIEAGFKFLDQALPQLTEINERTVTRIESLRVLSALVA